MSAAASTSQPNEISGPSPSATGGKAANALLFGIVLVLGMVWTEADDGQAASLETAMRPELPSDVVVVSLASLGFPAKTGVTHSVRGEASRVTSRAAIDPSPLGRALIPIPITLRPGRNMLHAMTMRLSGARRHVAQTRAERPRKVAPKFVAAYRSVLALVAFEALPAIERDVGLAESAIIGTASTYNPYREGKEEGSAETASGELYDPEAWTAAIQIDLRVLCGGVRYGRNYQPAYALVESGDKRAIVKINDVGPLKPGRVIDLNERSMRYFDPFLRRGLLPDVRVTLLPGIDWSPGPVGGVQLANFAGAR